jgi:hypothetical protein
MPDWRGGCSQRAPPCSRRVRPATLLTMTLAPGGRQVCRVDPHRTWRTAEAPYNRLVLFSHRIFRKQYFRALDAFKALARKGTFRLKVKAKGLTSVEGPNTPVEMHIEFQTPDDVEAMRFALNMRPFLDPESPHHYRKAWAHLAAEAPPEILTDKLKDALTNKMEAIEKGEYLAVAFEGEPLTAEVVYALLAEAAFFEASDDAQDELRRMSALPMFGPLAWCQFYFFTTDIYHVIERLQELSWEITRRVEVPAAPPKDCLWCKKKDGPFTSESHPLPEAFGNDKDVLPRGSVCDPCNYTMSPLEQRLVTFGPLAALRVMAVTHNKRGRYPSAQFEEMTWKRVGPRHIQVETLGPAPSMDGEFSITVTDKKPIEPLPLARAVFKIALEMVAFQFGHETALDAKYDTARDFVMGRRSTFPGTLILSTASSAPHGGINITTWVDIGTSIALDIFGVVFTFALEPNQPTTRPAGICGIFDLSIEPAPTQRRRTYKRRARRGRAATQT